MDRNALWYALPELTNYERAMINYIGNFNNFFPHDIPKKKRAVVFTHKTGEVRKYDNNFLFREGEVLEYFYVVISGSVCLPSSPPPPPPRDPPRPRRQRPDRRRRPLECEQEKKESEKRSRPRCR